MADTLPELRKRLIDEGRSLLQGPPKPIEFTRDSQADDLLNDLRFHPHAFVTACLMDRQITAERAWMIPLQIRERLGSFEMDDLARQSAADWLTLFASPSNLHRFPEKMSTVFYRAIQRIRSVYADDASIIWRNRPSSAAVVRRFLEFHGAGPKIATMAANILARDFRVPLSDYRCIDISADVHVLRVMARLGFVEEGASPDVVIYAAREANPDFPGVFDLILWDIGRDHCHPKAPDCPACRLRDRCPSALGSSTVAPTPVR